MKLETFFEKFELFTEAPDAVAKMRELVLELAVKGTLVDQDPDEGEGFELLSQIYEKNPPAKTRDEDQAINVGPTRLPRSWAPSKLGEVAEIVRGVSFPGSAKSETRSDGDVACLRTASVQAEIDWDDLIYISPNHVSRSDQWVAPNDIMISMANSYALVGKVAIVREVPQRATFGAFLAAIRPVLIEPYFLLYVLRSPRMQAAFRASSSQTTNIANISLSRMRPLPFPLPPLREQKRIVAKVDELMAFCDRLEAQQQGRETRHAALARASLARFADAPTPANLDLLFHKSYNIPQADFRKSILTLAVQGKLVPQDPNDEPAEELNAKLPDQLRAIADKVGARFSAPDVLIEGCDDLPAGWGLAAIQSIGITQTGTTPSKSESSYTGRDIPFIKPGDIQGDAIDYGNEGLSTVGLSAGRLIPKYSVLMVSIGGSIGKTALVDRDVSCNQQINSVTPADCIEPCYVLTAIRSGDFQSEVMKRAAQGTLPIISKGKWETIRIPVPPLAEQRRIVAKLDELMALVGVLETQLATARTTGATLVEAMVAELTGEA